MAEPYLGQITLFAGGYAPRGWAFCNGQLLQIAQFSALFAILGTTYGGDGRTNFGLPNLQGRVPMHWGSGPGLSTRFIGQTGGTESVALAAADMPSHSHPVYAAESLEESTPSSVLFPAQGEIWTSGTVSPAAMDASAIGDTGGGQPHSNMQPYLSVHFLIATLGIFPPRS